MGKNIGIYKSRTSAGAVFLATGDIGNLDTLPYNVPEVEIEALCKASLGCESLNGIVVINIPMSLCLVAGAPGCWR